MKASFAVSLQLPIDANTVKEWNGGRLVPAARFIETIAYQTGQK